MVFNGEISEIEKASSSRSSGKLRRTQHQDLGFTACTDEITTGIANNGTMVEAMLMLTVALSVLE